MTKSLTLFLCVLHLTVGAILNVPSQYSTIQSAINVAQSNDVIQVASGIYNEKV